MYGEQERIVEGEKAAHNARAMAGVGHIPSDQGSNRGCDVATTASLRSQASQKAFNSARDAARHERLAERLTPEIEAMLWCWQECIALGLIDARVITDALNREQRLGRDRY